MKLMTAELATRTIDGAFKFIERELAETEDAGMAASVNAGFDYGFSMASRHPEEPSLLAVATMAKEEIADGDYHTSLQANEEFALAAVLGAYKWRKTEEFIQKRSAQT